MSVRIGRFELKSVQNLHTEEARTLVEQRVPEQQGSVFQDLGREPVTVLLDGFLFGEDALSTLEGLRTAQAKAEPQPFSADIAVGTELTEVMIDEVRVRQIAGYRNRYRFFIRLKEHTEPPQSVGAETAPVNDSVAADAGNWGAGNLAGAGVLQDPASLPDALANNPALLQHLNMNDLSDSITNNMESLKANSLDGIVTSLAETDPSKADSLFAQLKNAGSLGSMISKYVSEGVDFAKKVDPSKLTGLVKAFAGSLDFFKALAEMAEQAAKVLDEIRQLELPRAITILKTAGGNDTPQDGSL